jgi:hypothetical protein
MRFAEGQNSTVIPETAEGGYPGPTEHRRLA